MSISSSAVWPGDDQTNEYINLMRHQCMDEMCVTLKKAVDSYLVGKLDSGTMARIFETFNRLQILYLNFFETEFVGENEEEVKGGTK